MIDRACISLNSNCNLKCKYCHFQDKRIDNRSFSLSDLILIVDNIHKYCLANELNNFKLGIVGSGEPTLKKYKIISLVKYIAEKHCSELKLYTITNGTLLTKEDLKIFYQYKDVIKLCFSLDGYRELHNLGRAKFDEVMVVILWYKEIFGESPAINATVNRSSYENKDKLISFFKDNSLFNVTFSKLIGYFEKDLYITDVQFNSFMEYVKNSGLNSRQFSAEKTYDCTMYGKLCGVSRTNIFITPEGIYPCGRFYKNQEYLMGNYNDSLYDIEAKVNAMTPVEDGKCYYIKNVEVK